MIDWGMADRGNGKFTRIDEKALLLTKTLYQETGSHPYRLPILIVISDADVPSSACSHHGKSLLSGQGIGAPFECQQ